MLDPKTIEQIKKSYPNFSFLFEPQASGFGDDLLALLVRAVNDPLFTNTLFDLEYAQTAYARETSNAAILFDKQSAGERKSDIAATLQDIRTAYGDLFDFKGGNKIAEQIARSAARLGLTGNRLGFYVNAEADRLKPADVETPTTTTAKADGIRAKLADFGYTPSDDEITAVLAGTTDKYGEVLNENVLIQRAKARAKGYYPGLSEQIDAGLSLEDMFSNYRNYAARTLELDPNQINFVDEPKWAQAFGSRDKPPMSLGEWVTYLKTNKDFGWQYTNQANQEVSSVVSALEKAFGFRK